MGNDVSYSYIIIAIYIFSAYLLVKAVRGAFFTKLETFGMTHSLLAKVDDCTFCNKENLKSVMIYENPYLSFIHENALLLSVLLAI